MWMLIHSKGSTYCLLVGKDHVVSRRDGDLILADDQSISRRHAVFSVEHDMKNLGDPSQLPVVTLTDTSSKYGIFINDCIEKSERMTTGSSLVLKNGDRIRFGLQWNEWRLEHRPLIVTTSTLTPAEKKKMKQHILKLGGHMVFNWNESVTHVTMKSLTLTVKVVCALACGVPIVIPNFWEKYVTALTLNQPVPDVKVHIPPLGESTLNTNEVSFDVNQNRKKLFSGKTFVFSTEYQYNNFSCMVNAAGGKSIMLNDPGLDNESLIDPDCIVMQYSFPKNSSDSHVPDMFQEVTKYLKSKGRRLIPECEIGLAVLHCSLEKNCNPRFNVTSAVLANDSKETVAKRQIVLALDTQEVDSDTVKQSKFQKNIIIPESGTVQKSPPSTVLAARVSKDNDIICSNLEKSHFTIGKIKRERLSTTDEVDASVIPKKRMKSSDENCLPKKKCADVIADFVNKPLVEIKVKEESEDEDLFKFPSDTVPKPKKNDSDDDEDMFAFSDEPKHMPSIEPSLKRKNVCTENEPVSKRIALETKENFIEDKYAEERVSPNEFLSVDSEKKGTTDCNSANLSEDVKNGTVVEVKHLLPKKIISEVAKLSITNVNNFKKFKKISTVNRHAVITSPSLVLLNIDRNSVSDTSKSDSIKNEDDDDDDEWAFLASNTTVKTQTRRR